MKIATFFVALFSVFYFLGGKFSDDEKFSRLKSLLQ